MQRFCLRITGRELAELISKINVSIPQCTFAIQSPTGGVETCFNPRIQYYLGLCGNYHRARCTLMS